MHPGRSHSSPQDRKARTGKQHSSLHILKTQKKAPNTKTSQKQIIQHLCAHWFWDTEILVRASRKGYRIEEIPVEWKGGKDTKVHLLKDSLAMGW
jgi:hypothetical protein